MKLDFTAWTKGLSADQTVWTDKTGWIFKDLPQAKPGRSVHLHEAVKDLPVHLCRVEANISAHPLWAAEVFLGPIKGGTVVVVLGTEIPVFSWKASGWRPLPSRTNGVAQKYGYISRMGFRRYNGYIQSYKRTKIYVQHHQYQQEFVFGFTAFFTRLITSLHYSL